MITTPQYKFYCWRCPHQWIGLYTIPANVQCPRCQGKSLISVDTGEEIIIIIDNPHDAQYAKEYIDSAVLLDDVDDLLSRIEVNHAR